MTRRTDRVGDLLRAELAELMAREVNDPRARGAVVTSVDASPDLKSAEVLVSILGSDEEREEAIGALRGAAGFLRSRLARKVRLRNIPELRFHLDRGAEHSQRISDLLESLHVNDDQSS
jgi:ribosome-binding factor A